MTSMTGSKLFEVEYAEFEFQLEVEIEIESTRGDVRNRISMRI